MSRAVLVDVDRVMRFIDERIRVYRLERDREGNSKQQVEHATYVVTAYQAVREEFVGACLDVEPAGTEA